MNFGFKIACLACIIWLASGCGTKQVEKSASNGEGGALDFLIMAPASIEPGIDFYISWYELENAKNYDLLIATQQNCTGKFQSFDGIKDKKQSLNINEIGSYYICLTANFDAKDENIVARNSGQLLEIKYPYDPPTLKITEPTGEDDVIATKKKFIFKFEFVSQDPKSELNFYYADSKLTCEGDPSENGWIAISEGTGLNQNNKSVTWDTSKFEPGNYWLCGHGSDRSRVPVYEISSSYLRVNSGPTISLKTPTESNASVVAGQTFDIEFTATDDDDEAKVSIYASENNTGCDENLTDNGWSLLTEALLEGKDTKYALQTGPFEGKTIYFCGKITDDITDPVFDLAPGNLEIKTNSPPTFTFIEPQGNDDFLPQNSNFSITFTPADTDNSATFSLYYKTTNDGCEGDPTTNSWTLLPNAQDLSEDDVTSYNLDTNTIPAGNYYICANITDSYNDNVYATSTGAVDINAAPSISITAPSPGDSVLQGNNFSITFNDSDPDDNATIGLYYKNAADGCSGTPTANGWTLIANSISEDAAANYSWDTTSVNTGPTYLCATIEDGINSTVYEVTSQFSILANDAPTLTINEPIGGNDNILLSESFDITFTASDSDNEATVSLYYKTDTSNCGGNPADHGWTLLTNTLTEGTDTSYTWSTAAPIGNYYICGVIDDAVNPKVYAVSSNYLRINSGPQLSITTPTGANANVVAGATFDVQFTASDDDDAAQISLFVSESNTGCATNPAGNGWTLLTNSLVEGQDTKYTLATGPYEGKTIYFCGEITDGVANPVFALSPGNLVVATNSAPSFSFVEPQGNNDFLTQNSNFNITFTATDTDNDASFSLYYKSTNTGCSGDPTTNSWTLLPSASDLSENSISSYNLDTDTIPAGNYYICAKISDGHNAAVYATSSGALDINAAPTLSITAPVAGDSVLQGDNLNITYNDTDPDDDATIALYYKSSADNCTGTPTANGWTLIAGSISENSTSQYTWDTTSIATGPKYICATISDGKNAVIYEVSGQFSILANDAPTLTINEPIGGNDSVYPTETFQITFTASDSDNDANVSLYYKTTSTSCGGDPATNGWTLLTNSLTEGTDSSFNWSPEVAPNSYYICGVINDGVNPKVYAVSSDTLTVARKARFTKVAAGENFTCALNHAGKAYCFGEDADGRLGISGVSADIYLPTAVTTAQLFTDITAGQNHACGLTASGEIYCWGSDQNGQLGNDANLTDQATPVKVNATGEFTKVSAGQNFTCAIKTDGSLLCWGDNTSDQIGNSAADATREPEPYAVSTTGLGASHSKFIDIATGKTHACALTTAGKVWCWGDDTNGQLGNAGGTSTTEPAAIDYTNLTNEDHFTQIYAGRNDSTCGITADGKGWCWGNDASDQLGNGNATVDVTSPSSLSLGSISSSKEFLAISVGFENACAIFADRKLACWGSDADEQAGDGAGTTTVDAPKYVTTTSISGESRFASVAVGTNHACAITVEGDLYCFGADNMGQSGNGGNSLDADVNAPSAVDFSNVATGAGFAKLDTATAYACGLSPRGRLYCWGKFNDGRLGLGTQSADFDKPNLISPVAFSGTKAIVDFSLGDSHACAITAEGKPYCWGLDSSGQLGDSVAATTQWSPVPVDISALSSEAPFVKISSGGQHTCGLLASGKIYCWGDDQYGQLGNGAGTTADQFTPSAVDVSALSSEAKFTTVASGATHTCASNAAGKAWCWGNDVAGQVGAGTASGTYDSPEALSIAASNLVTSISSNYQHACAIISGSSAWCWGSDTNEKLGNDTGGDQSAPGAIDTSNLAGDDQFLSISVANEHSCVLTSLGEVYCFGDNSEDQLATDSGVTASLATANSSYSFSGNQFIHVSAGNNFTCSLKVDSIAQCVGNDDNGQLGNSATTTTNQNSPVSINLDNL